MTQIAPLLNGFDLVGLQEDFDDANHQTLEDANLLPYTLRFGEPSDGRFYGSGLAVFSRYPIVDHMHFYYSACHGRFEAASDCLASKGFQVVRLRLGPGVEVDVYNTHMEAGGSDEDNAARAVHVAELLDAMNDVSAGRAIIFLADTNLHGDDPDDVPLIQRLLEGGGLADACDLVMCPEPGRIDRILIRNSATVELSVAAWRVEDAFFDSDGVPLSDHDAISAVIGWRRL